MHVRDVHESDRETRAVAPLLVNGQLVGPVTLVEHGGKVIGATDAELLRPHVGAKLVVATSLDGKRTAAIGNWGLSRHASLGLVELVEPITGDEVQPIDLGAVCASIDTRAPHAALIGIARDGAGFARTRIAVQLDSDDGGGMNDAPQRIASPLDDAHVGAAIDGAALFGWFSANPALGRASEVLVLGLAQAYRGFAKPRDRPVLAEIVGLDDLGRALIAASRTVEREPELRQVAGEIVERAVAGRDK